MAISLKHAFSSAKSDGADATLVQPSNWNAEHNLTMATGRLLGRTTASTGAVEEISAGTGLTLASGSLSLAGESLQGFRNRLINGGMAIAQRATSATVTAGTGVPTASTGYPAVDRWFVYSTGANVTAAQVAGAGAVQYRLQITGAASVTAIGVGQRIEQLNSYDLAGQTCTLSVDLANSLLTTVTWTASYATTTADTFGTIGTATKTQIATGTFTVNSTVTNYSVQIAVPSGATKGIEILFTVGAQTSGTWTIGNVQFEAGAVATPFERRDYGRELQMCQRYFEVNKYTLSGTNAWTPASAIYFAVNKRASPTITETSVTENLNMITPTFNEISTSFSKTYTAASASTNCYRTGIITISAEL